jgi:hypothetical protein
VVPTFTTRQTIHRRAQRLEPSRDLITEPVYGSAIRARGFVTDERFEPFAQPRLLGAAPGEDRIGTVSS